MQVTTFAAPNDHAACAHRVRIPTSERRFSIWFDVPTGTLADAEGFDRMDRATGVRVGSPQWDALAAVARRQAGVIRSTRRAAA
jgi:hypothetical protein